LKAKLEIRKNQSKTVKNDIGSISTSTVPGKQDIKISQMADPNTTTCLMTI